MDRHQMLAVITLRFRPNMESALRAALEKIALGPCDCGDAYQDRDMPGIAHQALVAAGFPPPQKPEETP